MQIWNWFCFGAFFPKCSFLPLGLFSLQGSSGWSLARCVMVRNDSRSPTGSMCYSWAGEHLEGRTFSSNPALAFLLPSCSSAWCCSIRTEAPPALVPATVRFLWTGGWLRRGESEGTEMAFVTPSQFSIGLLLESEPGCQQFLTLADPQKLQSLWSPLALQINLKNFLAAVAGGGNGFLFTKNQKTSVIFLIVLGGRVGWVCSVLTQKWKLCVCAPRKGKVPTPAAGTLYGRTRQGAALCFQGLFRAGLVTPREEQTSIIAEFESSHF